MPRNRLEPSNYRKLAKDNQLKWIGEMPERPFLATRWQCEICDRIMEKSYYTLKYQNNACWCRNNITLKMEDYEKLAKDISKELNVYFDFGDDVYPKNVHQEVEWIINHDYIYTASYHRLKYYKLPQELLSFVKEIKENGNS